MFSLMLSVIKKHALFTITATVSTLLLSGCFISKTEKCNHCCGDHNLLSPSAPIILPDKWNSPDGMTIGKDGNIYISINNVGDQSFPAKVAYIDKNDVIHEFSDLPPHPTTGKASPLGIVFGSDGNLYVADNQSFVTDERNMSRLIRINIDASGKAVGTEVVATGFTMANGISAYGDYIAINDTNIDPRPPLQSGTYRFKISELKGDPIQVTGIGDERLILTMKTQNKNHQVGANGVAYDKDGNLFVCNFGDAEIWKATFDKNNTVVSWKLYTEGKKGGLDCVDGLQIDSDGYLWTADFLGNSIAKICPTNGSIKIVAKNPPGTGLDGSMDAPSECIKRGNKIYVANIDLSYGPNQTDDFHSISVFELR